MTQMTAQEIFNKVATHLFTQGEPAVENGGCCYRTSAGLMCAAGCLIDDAEYDPSFESEGVQSRTFDSFSWAQDNNTRYLVRSLQRVHDSDYNPSAWLSTDKMRSDLRSVAVYFNLDSSILDTLSFKDR